MNEMGKRRRKTNLIIEHECAQNWLSLYREQAGRGKKVDARKYLAMRRHEKYLARHIG